MVDLGQQAKLKFSRVMAQVIKRVYDVSLTNTQVNDLIVQQMSRPKHDRGDICVPCFRFTKLLKSNPIQIAEALAVELNKDISVNGGELYISNPYVKVEALKGYLNIYLKPSYLGGIIELILNSNDSYLDTLPWDKERCNDIKRVMVEYSQPNTHKAFHVGHMRNVALGDCLVRLYEHCGYSVVAANYFGDEGAHGMFLFCMFAKYSFVLIFFDFVFDGDSVTVVFAVVVFTLVIAVVFFGCVLCEYLFCFALLFYHSVAKCLWLLQKKIDSGVDLDALAPAEGKGEWLGAFYTEAVQKLSIKSYTLLPFKGIVSAIVLSKKKHPDGGAPANWNVVEVDYGAGKQATVVCGGDGYEIGDYVPYVPVGGKFNGKDVISKDMKGVTSSGVIMSARELGVNIEKFARELDELRNPEKYEKLRKEAEEKKKEEEAARAKAKAEAKNKQQNEDEKNANQSKKKDKKSKKNKNKNKGKNKNQQSKPKIVDKRILVLSKYFENIKPGQSIINVARIPNTDIDEKTDIEEIVEQRDKEQRIVLHGLESEEDKWVKLWQKTRQWSVDDFHKIYDWLGARFDHDFCESECSKPSRKLVDTFYKEGIFVKDSGAIGIHLGGELGFCMLLKSDGTGLYATKDLALAQIKFDKYKIDKSIYVVDSAQSHHFKQVFATLGAMKYPQAKNCFHLAYAFVTLPEGRMASRQGRVVLFSELTKLLSDEIKSRVLKSKKGGQSNNENDNGNNDNDTVTTSKATENKEENENDDENDNDNSNKQWEKIMSDEKEWTDAERLNAERLISVGTIRYGMLNHDPNKEIVFDLKEWSDTQGNTGPYLMYQYTRVASISRNVERPNDDVYADYGLLDKADEKLLLHEMSEFQNRVIMACDNANPSVFCSYLYNIASTFSAWYSRPENNIKNCKDDVLKVTKLEFAEALAKTLKKGLSLLGIEVLERM